MAETRARRRIRQAVELRGYQLVELTWEPWYDAGEKSGIGGGWYGRVDRDFLKNTHPGDDFMGLSVEEVLNHLDGFMEPPEACDCPSVFDAHFGRDGFVHGPECRWHFRYWLPWWGVKEVAS